MRSYTPPRRVDDITPASLQQRIAGERSMSIDTLVSQLQDRSGSVLPRGLGNIGVGKRPTC